MKPQPALDVPQITEPCAQSWEAMPGTARVRHCDVCRKDVVNLAAMSTAEIHVLLTGPLPCMRIARYDDGTLVTMEPQRTQRPMGLAAGLLTAAMAFGSASAQQAQQPALMGAPPPATTATLSGRIADVAGKPVAGVHLKLVQGSQTVLQITPSADGSFHLTSVPGSYQLIVEGEGIVARTLPVTLDKTTNLTQTIKVSRLTPSRRGKTGGNGEDKVIGVTLGMIARPTPKPAPPSFPTMGSVVVSGDEGKIPVPPVTTPLLPPK